MPDEKRNLKNIVLISSTGNDSFAKKISKYLGKPLAKTERTGFRDSDLKLRIAENESVRGKDVYVIMTYHPPISKRLQEMIVWTDSLIGGSAERITFVLPYFFGSRQDRKTLRGEPINFRAYLNALKGVAQEHQSRIGFMTADLHAGQLQALAMYFDNLDAMPLFSTNIKKKFGKDVVIVSPDTGGLKKAEKLARMVGTDNLSCITKTRSASGKTQNYGISGGDVSGKTAVIIDDIIDSAGTLVQAVDLLKSSGVKQVAVYATHLLLNPPAVENIRKLNAKVIGTDTVHHYSSKIKDLGLEILPLSNVFAEVIKRKHFGISTRELYTEEVEEICMRYKSTTL